MPNYANISFDQKLSFLKKWLADCTLAQREEFGLVLYETSRLRNDNLAHQLDQLRSSQLETSNGRPLSLFDCRLKVMRQWYFQWSEDERQNCIHSVTAVDPSLFKDAEEIRGKLSKDEQIVELISQNEDLHSDIAPLVNGRLNSDCQFSPITPIESDKPAVRESGSSNVSSPDSTPSGGVLNLRSGFPPLSSSEEKEPSYPHEASSVAMGLLPITRHVDDLSLIGLSRG